MFRPPVSRRFVGIAFAVSIGTGIGAGAVGVWSVAGADTPPVPRVGTASATAPADATASSPLTMDQATAIATQASPGRVVEVKEDREVTGLRYDVTLVHENGTATEIEVDAATGQVVTTEHDDDWDGN
jgi:hypothetical protein